MIRCRGGRGWRALRECRGAGGAVRGLVHARDGDRWSVGARRRLRRVSWSGPPAASEDAPKCGTVAGSVVGSMLDDSPVGSCFFRVLRAPTQVSVIRRQRVKLKRVHPGAAIGQRRVDGLDHPTTSRPMSPTTAACTPVRRLAEVRELDRERLRDVDGRRDDVARPIAELVLAERLRVGSDAPESKTRTGSLLVSS